MTQPATEEPDTLVEVEIESDLGAHYKIPDCSWKLLWQLTRSESLHGFPSLSLVNVSQACLVIPTRIIKTISANGQILWRSPTNTG